MSVGPVRRIRIPLLPQAWRTVTFVHWRYDSRALQPTLPRGLTVQERDGSAWISLTALHMRDLRPAGPNWMPRWPAFAETNLRTYVQDPSGREGIWFYSLDAASTAVTYGARLMLGLPYARASAGIDAGDGQDVAYWGVRAASAGARYRLRIRPGAPVPPDDLGIWLTHRWRAYTQHLGCLLEIPVRHGPWPLQAAEITTLEQSLTTAAGLPDPRGQALVHYSCGVADVVFGAPRPVRRTARRRAAKRQGAFPL